MAKAFSFEFVLSLLNLLILLVDIRLYPVGEGAGYAGGIVSAAVDGMRAAERIISRFKPMHG